MIHKKTTHVTINPNPHHHLKSMKWMGIHLISVVMFEHDNAFWKESSQKQLLHCYLLQFLYHHLQLFAQANRITLR